MPNTEFFDAVIQASSRGGAFVTVPFDVERVFGSKRPKVAAKIDGVPYRGSLVRMGGPDHLLIVRKDIRATIGKEPGDTVAVAVSLDTAPREVQVPADFKRMLDDNRAAGDFFDTLSYTNRKEYVAWIEGAKRSATRSDRIQRAATMLAEGRRAP